MQSGDQPRAVDVSRQWSRRQLYDLVWSKPMRDAAADVGMSDGGLKKLCLRHRVPVPPQGYWNKVNAGRKPVKRAFREVEGAKINRIFVGPILNDVLAGLVAHAAYLNELRQARQRAPERQERERRRDEESHKLAELERARIDFLVQRLRSLDEIQKLDRLLVLLDASTPHAGALSTSYQAFVQWAQLRLERLRQACSVQTLETLLANSPLFADRS